MTNNLVARFLALEKVPLLVNGSSEEIPLLDQAVAILIY